MKTPTMPEDRAISVSPASTHGIPVAPSAARLDRLRRPIAIIAPQPIRPNTPATRAPHFHQPSSVLTGPGQAGRRQRSRVRHPAASPRPVKDRAGRWRDGGRPVPREGTASSASCSHQRVKVAAGGRLDLGDGAQARRGSGTRRRVVRQPQAEDERNPDHRPGLGLQQPEPVPVAAAGSGQPSLTTATTATLPPCRVTAVTALVA